METNTLIQQLYVAYYGRPADTGGLNYWVGRLEDNGGDLSEVINAFAASAEFEERFGNLSEEELVNNMYQQILGRPAEDEGLEFYTSMLARGDSSLIELALDIANGAQGTDTTTIQNRVEVAKQFTQSMAERGLDYGSIEAAGQLLAGVTSATNVSEYIQNSVEALLDTLPAADNAGSGEAGNEAPSTGGGSGGGGSTGNNTPTKTFNAEVNELGVVSFSGTAEGDITLRAEPVFDGVGNYINYVIFERGDLKSSPVLEAPIKSLDLNGSQLHVDSHSYWYNEWRITGGEVTYQLDDIVAPYELLRAYDFLSKAENVTFEGGQVVAGHSDYNSVIKSITNNSDILVGKVFYQTEASPLYYTVSYQYDGLGGIFLEDSPFDVTDFFVAKQMSDLYVDGISPRDGDEFQLKDMIGGSSDMYYSDIGSSTIVIDLSKEFEEIRVHGFQLGTSGQADTVMFDIGGDYFSVSQLENLYEYEKGEFDGSGAASIEAGPLLDKVETIAISSNQTSYYKLFEPDVDEMFTFTIGFDTSNDGEADSFLVLYDVIGSTSNGMTSDGLSFSEDNYAHLMGIENLANQIPSLDVATSEASYELADLLSAAAEEGVVFSKPSQHLEDSGFIELLGIVATNFDVAIASVAAPAPEVL